MLYMASDHGGLKLKEELKLFLDKKKIKVKDLGTFSKDFADYPDYAKKVARRVSSERGAKGILICGTGTGMAMAANRYRGVRAAVAYDDYSARRARRDNDCNILCLRGRKSNFSREKRILSIWLNTPFSGIPRYRRRIKKLDNA